jgi:Fe2+ or Zn2+ uptake regulation protein
MSSLIIEATAAVREAGGRMTPQRQLILETLDTLGGHPTAEQVLRAAQRRNAALHPTTVYRTLAWLTDAGLVTARHLEPRGDRCEHYDPVSPVEHHHFVCTGCGCVIEFEAAAVAQVKRQFAERNAARVDLASLTLHGLCAQCLSSGASHEEDPAG